MQLIFKYTSYWLFNPPEVCIVLAGYSQQEDEIKGNVREIVGKAEEWLILFMNHSWAQEYSQNLFCFKKEKKGKKKKK